MPLFFLHLSNGLGFVEDTEGQEHPDLRAARAAGVQGLRDVLAGELRDGNLNTASFVEIEDETHELVATIMFADVVEFSDKVQRQPRRV
jgi:hypothetical protein